MKNTVKILSAIVIALVAASFTISDDPSGYKPGDLAIDFKLRNVDGKMVQLADNKKAKGFIVVFTCNHCPFSQAYEDRIIELDKKYASKGYPVIAINPNDVTRSPEDSYAKMQERSKEKRFTFAYLHDETQQIAKTYGATRTPHVYLLKRTAKGNEVVYVGAIDDNYEDAKAVKEKYVEAAVDALLANKAVAKTSTKAI
ncbi:MAG: thioredoxin family protein, partial [Bacteroidota bacterium]